MYDTVFSAAKVRHAILQDRMSFVCLASRISCIVAEYGVLRYTCVRALQKV